MGSGFVDVEGGSIWYEVTGKGDPLVLIHAGYVDSRMWDGDIAYLSGTHMVIRYDVRGFGQSSRPTAPYSDYRDLEQLLDSLDIDKAIIIGVSNGGRIATDFAVENPGRVTALVLVNSGIRGYESGGKAEDSWPGMEKAERNFLKLRGEGKMREAAEVDVNYWSHGLSGTDRDKLLDIAEKNVSLPEHDPDKFQVSPEPPAFGRIGELSMPVLIIIGADDINGIIEIDTAINEKIAGSQLVRIEGADHLPNLSAPDLFKETLSGFLESV